MSCGCYLTRLSVLQEYKGPSLTPAEVERIENLQRYTLNNAHYFCETADITRPFPSRVKVSDPSWEFVWNRWLAASVRELGLEDLCPHLLQVPPPPLSPSPFPLPPPIYPSFHFPLFASCILVLLSSILSDTFHRISKVSACTNAPSPLSCLARLMG